MVHPDIRPVAIVRHAVGDNINARLGGKENLAQFGNDYFDQDEQRIGEQLFQEIFLRYMIERPSVGGGELLVEGFSNLLSKPEFSMREDAYRVIRFFENKCRLLSVFDTDTTDSTCVKLGNELGDDTTQELAAIMAPYRMNSIAIGVDARHGRLEATAIGGADRHRVAIDAVGVGHQVAVGYDDGAGTTTTMAQPYDRASGQLGDGLRGRGEFLEHRLVPPRGSIAP